ncbi:MAG: galactose mutarotase [Clostridia bacterium]|nr:galactose mutarotase [Clostridia bacterium]
MKKLYDKIDGKEVYLYTISDGNLEVDICDMGARINAIRVNGIDIALGFNSIKDYMYSGTYAGATIGRVANRIAGGHFELNGTGYHLNTNDGKNHLHGGNEGFDIKLFTVLDCSENSATMQYISADGEENYPGTFELTVKFTVENNCLLIDFEGVSDKDTLWCPTNHAYFNLDGESSGDCRANLLRINADYYTPVNEGLIPTGEKRELKGTPFDFNSLKRIGTDFNCEQLQQTNGYDHNFVLNGEHAAHVESSKTGIKMDVYTDMPCIQLYTGGQLSGCNGKTIKYNQWAGFCLEPQYCPNAINMNGFDKPILKKGEERKHYINVIFNKIF